ncbi:hypothetical protein RJT34_18381 [Clitoria ternatea]|uniref:DUF4378 domain-containing protein n=1 Tax=Clitoria ternatea TaxID=43366 RepID=A0AAN9PFS0_CLITE
MSRKALKSLKEENADLQKQIGCITGFFQLFDRHRFLTGQRSNSSYIQHRPTSGGGSNDIKELNSTKQKAKTKNVTIASEKQQLSTESSVTSLSSSSCSSSMSSLEVNRTIHKEPPSTNQTKTPKNKSPEVVMKQLDTPDQQSINFHHIVKDSMHREAKGLYVKTVAKEEKKPQTHALKHIDSPRPLRSNKCVNTGVTSEPVHTLAKSMKAPWDSPRLSYDDTFKSATKHKEIPRLSLDSREGSNRGFNEGNKSNNLFKGPQKGYRRNSNTMINQLQELDTSKRSSSVVAKLMGLEALPDCTQTCGSPMANSSCSTKKNDFLARSSTSDEDKQHQRLTLHQSRRADSITNATPSSRFALESIPWRQPDASQSSQLQASKSSLNVYGEIEKRVAELEFKKSGKDLRALKQILEAMQRHKNSADIARDQALNSPSHNSNKTWLHESSKEQNFPASGTVEMSNSTRGSKSPIVIMKPEKVTRKSNNPSTAQLPIHVKSGLSKYSLSNPTNGRLAGKKTAKAITSSTKRINDPCGQPVQSSDKNTNMRTSKVMQSLKAPPPQDINGESTINPGNLTMTGSPRLQKMFGLERHSPPTSPSSDSINRREHNRQPVDLSTPTTTPKHKFSTLQERNECFSEISCHWREFKHHVNVISPDLDNQRSLDSQSEIEVIRVDHSGKIISTSIQLSGMNQYNAFEVLRKESSKAETIFTVEQPSPVSVLDAAFYREDPPSPVKKTADISKNLAEALSTDDDSEESTVEILQEIDCNDEKIIKFNNNKDPDHKYITEILLASGVLNDHGSSQIFHSPGHMINPKLFFALEQMKTKKRLFNIDDSLKKIASRTNYPEQMQRKLIFDVVNDILVQKLILDSSSALWFQPNEIASRKLKGQQLLDELCSEIDQLQPENRNVSQLHEDENLKHHRTVWTNSSIEIPNIVLDIERMIFKDLVTEVVRGEVANDPGTHCRQLLFPK